MQCQVCSNESQYKCGKCLLANYCSARCQQQDWEAHSEKCQKIGMPKRKASDNRREEIEEKILKKEILQQEIAEKKEDVEALDAELKELIEEERNSVDENPLSPDEEEILTNFLTKLKKSEGTPPWNPDKWEMRDEGETKEAYYVEVSVETPSESVFKKEKYESVALAGFLTFSHKIRESSSFDEQAFNYTDGVYEDFAENHGNVLPSCQIIGLMKRAHVTLVMKPKKYWAFLTVLRSDWVADEKYEDVDGSVSWGFYAGSSRLA